MTALRHTQSRLYPVNDLYITVQGEGCQTGVPMILLRLQGCDVGCPWCDTKETWHIDAMTRVAALPLALGANPRWAEMIPEEIVREVRDLPPGPRWVLVTGGEPALHDLRELVAALHDEGFKVALETSGTAAGHLGADFDWICVSPKVGMPGEKSVLSQALEGAHEIKMVVGSERDIQRLDGLLAGVSLWPGATICLQPVFLSQKATDLCIQVVKVRGWRLSLQTHKFIAQP